MEYSSALPWVESNSMVRIWQSVSSSSHDDNHVQLATVGIHGWGNPAGQGPERWGGGDRQQRAAALYSPRRAWS